MTAQLRALSGETAEISQLYSRLFQNLTKAVAQT